MAFALRVFTRPWRAGTGAWLAALAGVAVWTPLLLTSAESHTPPAGRRGVGGAQR